MQLVIHAPFGGRINKAWGLALRKRFCRSFNLELQAAATDDGLNISLAEQHSFPLADVFRFLHPASLDHVIEQAVLASPIFTARWRWDSSRSLMLLRFQGGKKVAPQIQRMRAVDTPVPSQFSHEILNANPFAYLDDAPLEERRARAVEMRSVLPEAILSEVGRLDPAAIEEVCADAWPDVRDAEELHDALLSLVALPITADHAAERLNSLRTKLHKSVPLWA